MKKSGLSIYGFIPVALLIVMGCAAGTTYAQVDQILANMQNKAKTMTTLKASLLQEKRNTQIGGPPEVTSGELLFKRAVGVPDKIRINYNRPSGQVVAVIGNKITLYQSSIHQAIETTRQAQADKNQEYSFITTPYSSASQLKLRYTIEHIRDEGNTAVLQLLPKQASAAKKILIWVDKGLWLPIKYQIVETNSVTTFTLNNPEINPKISNADFPISLPPGTKIIHQ